MVGVPRTARSKVWGFPWGKVAQRLTEFIKPKSFGVVTDEVVMQTVVQGKSYNVSVPLRQLSADTSPEGRGLVVRTARA